MPIRKFRVAEEIAAESQLTEEDAEELGKAVKHAVTGHYCTAGHHDD